MVLEDMDMGMTGSDKTESAGDGLQTDQQMQHLLPFSLEDLGSQKSTDMGKLSTSWGGGEADELVPGVTSTPRRLVFD